MDRLDAAGRLTHVKFVMRDIQDQPIAGDVKIQKQRTLIESEMARVRLQMREIQESDSTNKKAGTWQDSEEASASARDRRKRGIDNLQKLLDILRSMNPQI